MKTYRFTIETLSAFGTPLVGDSLFGQLCWAIVHKFGEHRLTELLQGYDNQRPFLVISDGFPHNHLPLPILPSYFWLEDNKTPRKILKKKQWIVLSDMQQPLNLWQQLAKTEAEVMEKQNVEQPHNTLNRQTGTTGEGQFAPYSMNQIWYKEKSLLDLYVVIDETRFSLEEVTALFEYIGKVGFGRDASIGLGKFAIHQIERFNYPKNTGNAYLTLANSAPQNLGMNKEYCYYQITTRFGRHGDIYALGQNPFKKPIILAKSAAVFTPLVWEERLFLGNGLTNISYAQPNAVHQGYAPVMPLSINFIS